MRALAAGKHVLCEKPIGVSVEEVEELAAAVKASGKVLQVGHMKRFDPGLEAARDFVRDEMGELLALKAWYCDSTHRYTMTDAVQPLPVTSAARAGSRATIPRPICAATSCWRMAATSSTRRASWPATSSRSAPG